MKPDLFDSLINETFADFSESSLRDIAHGARLRHDILKRNAPKPWDQTQAQNDALDALGQLASYCEIVADIIKLGVGVRLMYGPTCIRYNGDVAEEVPNELFHETRAKHKVGDVLRSYAGAPGIGHVDQRIVRIDDTGVYGVIVENTIRELTPREVR